jgi:hypothetical protein
VSPIKKTRYAKRSKVTLARLQKKGRELLVTLANASDNGINIVAKKFPALRKYAPQKLLQHRDELLLAWPRWGSFEGLEGPTIEPGLAVDLYEEWQRAAGAVQEPLEQWLCEHWLASEKYTVKVFWDRNKLLYPNQNSLPAQLAWDVVHNADRLGFCRNPDCARPRFIKRKDDQIYCSLACSVPTERERKRRWWAENRSKKRKTSGTHKTR